MIFCDVNTFFSDRGGGIRTYHRAKIDWFRRHPEHTYYVVRPGERYREEALADNVTLVEAYGPKTGAAYRFLLDYARVGRLLRRIRPDVLEAGDPWLTGVMAVVWKTLGIQRGLTASFFHGDTIRTFVDPWANRPGMLRWPRRAIAGALGAPFYWLQRRYDVTVVTSQVMGDHLERHGVQRLALAPLGADRMFFEIGAARSAEDLPENGVPRQPVRILHAGRLSREKGTRILLEILPRLLDRSDVTVTIAGRGEFEPQFAAIEHPRYRFLGYVSDRQQIAQLYREHDLLLAPGPYETFGLAVLEGLAAGLTVVAPDQGGAAELLHETALPFMFAAEDAASFWQAIERALASDLVANRRAGCQTAARYGGWDDVFERLIGHYAQLVREGKENRPGRAKVPAWHVRQGVPQRR